MKFFVFLCFYLIPFYILAQNTTVLDTVELPENVEIEFDDGPDEPKGLNAPIYERFDVSEVPRLNSNQTLEEFLAESLEFPESNEKFKKKKAAIVVIVVFVVNIDGSVSNLSILGKSKNDIFEAEALRVVKSTNGKWIPANKKEESVRMRLRIPIRFIRG